MLYPKLLRPHEALKVLGIVGRDKLYQLLREGQIQSIRVGRNYFIPESALLRFMAGPMYNDPAFMGAEIGGHNERSAKNDRQPSN